MHYANNTNDHNALVNHNAPRHKNTFTMTALNVILQEEREVTERTDPRQTQMNELNEGKNDTDELNVWFKWRKEWSWWLQWLNDGRNEQQQMNEWMTEVIRWMNKLNHKMN